MVVSSGSWIALDSFLPEEPFGQGPDNDRSYKEDKSSSMETIPWRPNFSDVCRELPAWSGFLLTLREHLGVPLL